MLNFFKLNSYQLVFKKISSIKLLVLGHQCSLLPNLRSDKFLDRLQFPL